MNLWKIATCFQSALHAIIAANSGNQNMNNPLGTTITPNTHLAQTHLMQVGYHYFNLSDDNENLPWDTIYPNFIEIKGEDLEANFEIIEEALRYYDMICDQFLIKSQLVNEQVIRQCKDEDRSNCTYIYNATIDMPEMVLANMNQYISTIHKLAKIKEIPLSKINHIESYEVRNLKFECIRDVK